MTSITTACLDMAGTTVSDDGSVMAAFTAAVGEFGLEPGEPGYDEAIEVVHATMGQSKIEVFRRILGDDERAQQANRVFEASYADAVRAGQVAPLPGAAETITALRAAGIRVCLATGFAPATRDALLDALGWWPLIDLALSPADAGRGRPWPDLPLTALIRLGGGAVSELAVVGDTPSDVTAGLRAGAGLVAGVLTGSGSREELEKAGAPHILDSVTGLLPLLGLGSGRPLHAHRASDDNGSADDGSADDGSADNGSADDDGEDSDSSADNGSSAGDSGPAEAGQPGQPG